MAIFAWVKSKLVPPKLYEPQAKALKACPK